MAEQQIDYAQHERLVLTETIGSVLWFLMDGFWMLALSGPAKAMVLPTLAVNLFVFRYTKRSFSQIAVVSAMNCWLLMNIFWMISDLDKDPRLMIVAQALFGLGILLLVAVVVRNAARGERLTQVLAHFRRLRV